MAQIIVEELHKSYQLPDKKLDVIKKLSFKAELGKITVLLGRSGCGKTTLLRLLCGLESPESGSIIFPDQVKVGMMFQEARLMPWLTCEENIAFSSGQDFSPKELGQLLEVVGLSSFAQAYPSQLSGGMQQRVALARTLAQHSQLVLMDEPFAALDYFTRLQMQQEVLRIKQLFGTGIIFVTHNIDEALAIGDKLLIMQDGTIAREIQLPESKCRDVLREPYIGIKRQILQALTK